MNYRILKPTTGLRKGNVASPLEIREAGHQIKALLRDGAIEATDELPTHADAQQVAAVEEAETAAKSLPEEVANKPATRKQSGRPPQV